jgi:hypothetical protein
MSLFDESQKELNDLKHIEPETDEAPECRLTSPGVARAIHERNRLADDDGSFNRSLVQQQMDFVPPHDDTELENKGQSDRFNITTGEGPVIKGEAVSAYLDIYTTPKNMVDVPLKPEVDPNYASTWSNIIAEEFTKMERKNKDALAKFLQLADTFVTHGVAITYFDDSNTMEYSVAGLDHFKFPRKTGISTNSVEMATAEGEYTVAELWRKINGGDERWNEEAVKRAIKTMATKANATTYDNWEVIERELKANEMGISGSCEPIEVIHCWVKEADGKVSYYILTKHGLSDEDKKRGAKEDFLFNGERFYDEMEQAMQLFCYNVGNGGRLYTVRGLGYLIYQLCNAGDIMHNKMLENARVGSSLIVQADNSEDLDDLQLIDFGGGIALPPTMRVVEQRFAQNINNTLIPAIEANQRILNRATGGIASGQLMLNPEGDRRTKIEVSSQLDYINKLNSFGVSLFYGPYEAVMKEKFRRTFKVDQKNKQSRKRVKEMKQKCIDRGVPESVFEMIDFENVKVARIIGTGSRASRIMLMDQIGQRYSTWSANGRKNYDYDYVMMLADAEVAERYAGLPSQKKVPYDSKIAQLENMQMFEGDYIEPEDGEDHLVHLSRHVPYLEDELKEVQDGQVDMIEWTMNHVRVYEHAVATLEITTVHESLEPELNQYKQRVQQVGELVVNGLKMINKAKREGMLDEPQGDQGAAGQQAEMSEEEKASKKTQRDLQEADMKHKQKLQQMMELQMLRLKQIKQLGEQQMVAEAQKNLHRIALKSSEVEHEMQKARAKAI